jgi:fibronectin type 3 domain-containing protein
VDLHTLTEKIYFRVTSVDFKMNISPFSDIIEVKIPDTIPPLPPIIHDYRSGASYAEIFWYPGSSLDAEKQLLYRRHNDSTEHILVVELPNSVSYYKDSTVMSGAVYFYTLYCVDDDGLQSKDAPSVFVSIPHKNQAKDGLQNIRLSKKDNRVNITWDATPVKSIKIYRKEGDGHLLTYKVLPGDTTSFTDEKVSRRKRYSYAFQVFDHRGNRSPISEHFQIRL